MGKNQQGAHYKRISIHRAVDVLYDAVASGADVLRFYAWLNLNIPVF